MSYSVDKIVLNLQSEAFVVAFFQAFPVCVVLGGGLAVVTMCF